MKKLSLLLLLFAVLLGSRQFARADDSGGEEPFFFPTEYTVDSRTGRSADEPFVYDIVQTGAPWLRIRVGDYFLAEGDYLQFTSLKDGSTQRHDATTLEQWGSTTAYFNGDSVRVELVAESAESYFTIQSVWVGNAAPRESASLCDGDNRAPSGDNRVGRVSYVNAAGNYNGTCTAWSISTGAMLTAGHCADFDPDQGGSGLPDGNLDMDAFDLIEFNVPLSDANGVPQFANADDQYTIDLNSVTWEFAGSGQGLGNDWAVFHVNPNPNTNQIPHLAYDAWFRITRDAPAEDAAIRITGYGTDTQNNRNNIQQTSNGPFLGESSDGGNLYHEYQVDTEGGNSGGPIIWDANGYGIGIHANGGCDPGTFFDDGNTGTSLENDDVENAIDHSFSLTAIHVDNAHRNRTTGGSGSPLVPFSSLTAAVNYTSFAESQMRIVEGSYNESLVITKRMTLIAPVGTVVIGEP